MAIEIKVPRLGWSMEQGTFVEWLKREGQHVNAGEPLFAIEGDKAIQEVEAVGTGTLRISPRAPENGETVQVGLTLAFLTSPGEPDPFDSESISHLSGAATIGRGTRPSSPDTGARPAEDRIPTAAANQDRASARRPPANGPRISPRAARVAAELGVDWKEIPGSGRDGRIRERDVRARASATLQPAALPARAAAQSSFRRTIAARMTEGAQATAPVTLTTTSDATNLVSLRAQFKAAAKSTEEQFPSYADIIAKLAARALVEHPDLNQQWIDGRIASPDGVHIAIAVDTPAGLVAPVVRNVAALGLREIAARTSDLKSRALAGLLKPGELTGGTFTITNLGSFGIDAFTPIINVPQCAILGLGRIERRPAVVGDQVVPRDAITLSLTFDHRIVDGAPAARFLATLRTAIENPGPWLVF